MPKALLIGGLLAIAMAVYAIVDLTVTDDRRIRRLNRVLWAVLIIVLPIVGPVLWLAWGKGPRSDAPPEALEDSASFRTPMGTWVSADESDRRILDLEAQLAALDAEQLADDDRRARGADVDPPGAVLPEADAQESAATEPRAAADERDDDPRRG